MSLYVVDASIAVKWFFKEERTEESLGLLSFPNELCAPDFLWTEVSIVVCQRIARKQLLSEEGLLVLPALRRLPIQIFPSANLLDAAIDMAIETAASLYDCLYLALAVLREARMVTADRRFCRALESSQFANRVMWIGNIR